VASVGATSSPAQVDARAHGPEDGMTDAQRLALILAILRAAVASGDARARVLADVEEVARG